MHYHTHTTRSGVCVHVCAPLCMQEWTGEATLGDALLSLAGRLPRCKVLITTRGTQGAVMLERGPSTAADQQVGSRALCEWQAKTDFAVCATWVAAAVGLELQGMAFHGLQWAAFAVTSASSLHTLCFLVHNQVHE